MEQPAANNPTKLARQVWTKKALLVLAVLMLTVTAALAWYTNHLASHKLQTLTVNSQRSKLPESSQPVGQTKAQTYPVYVYFSKSPESYNDPTKVFAVSRISASSGVAKFAIQQLIYGPTASEKKQGYFSKVIFRSKTSNCGGDDFRLSLVQGVVTLRFCRQFDHVGVIADGQAEIEIDTTLMQFPTIQKVIILNRAGDCEFDLSGMNSCKL